MKIFLDMIGCRLNQAEIEAMARQFRAAGHEIVASAVGADLAVINTCTVTSAAASDARAAIRRAARAGVEKIAVTGCWATLEPDEAAELPNVRRIIPNLEKDSLAADLLDLPGGLFDLEPLARQPLPGLRQRTRAFIKVQDGCDNACTYCITRLARGPSRSRSVDEVLADVRAALEGGTQEAVLTSVQLGSWGRDLDPPQRLPDLVSVLLARSPVPRLRLSSLEPWELDRDFFLLWQEPRLCRHLHLPLQSGSAEVLKRMARKITPDDYAALVEAARAVIPQVAITTDVIAGFPGETPAEFDQTLAFVGMMGFAGGHVFSYSARPGTPAARMKGQVQYAVRKERSAILREALAASSVSFRQKLIGQELAVLWESSDRLSDSGWQLHGLTGNYVRVTVIARQPRWNVIEKVRLEALIQDGVRGTIIEGRTGTRP